MAIHRFCAALQDKIRHVSPMRVSHPALGSAGGQHIWLGLDMNHVAITGEASDGWPCQERAQPDRTGQGNNRGQQTMIARQWQSNCGLLWRVARSDHDGLMA